MGEALGASPHLLLSDPFEKAHPVLSSSPGASQGAVGKESRLPELWCHTCSVGGGHCPSRGAWTALQKLAGSSGKPQRASG